MTITTEDLHNRFDYHPPTGVSPALHEAIRKEHFELAERIVQLTPEGREQSLAITHLEESMMWANAAIARGVNRA